jgi:hypothetical protein
MAKKAKQYYRCLAGITHDPTGVRWEIGDTLKDGDIPAEMIATFLTMTPPVLELVAVETGTEVMEHGKSRQE